MENLITTTITHSLLVFMQNSYILFRAQQKRKQLSEFKVFFLRFSETNPFSFFFSEILFGVRRENLKEHVLPADRSEEF